MRVRLLRLHAHAAAPLAVAADAFGGLPHPAAPTRHERSPAPEDNWVGYLNGSPKTNFAKFEEYLKQGGTKFLACDMPTAPDFHLFEMIDQHVFLAAYTSNPSPIADFPLLTAYYAAFKEIPQVVAYLAGDLGKLPINNKMASFGAKPDGAAWS